MNERRGVLCHIEYRGLPLCATRYTETPGVTCSYLSLAAARRAMVVLGALAWGFKIVRGACPDTL